ncbi:MAG TPA: flagellar hook-basal body complex protein [Alphaproteobacteria bacterium]|nr:flagellar hook-basal body complex protein [Alphaproteobacteria bacterium]
MTLSSSMLLGVQGLSSNAQRLAGVSDNIANSATVGYKRVDTSFTSFVLSESGQSYAPGGVTASTTRDVTARGALQTSDSPTDLAVGGRGFIPILRTPSGLTNPQASPVGQGEFLLTTTGSFRSDASGFLRNPNGDYLLGWPSDRAANPPRDSITALRPIRTEGLPSSAAATEQVTLRSNLPAGDTLTGATPPETYRQSVEVFDELGTKHRLEFSFTAKPSAPTPSNLWDFTLRDAQTNVIGNAELEFAATGPLAGSLTKITPAGPATVDPVTGAISVTGPGGPLDIDIGAPGTGEGTTQFASAFEPQTVERDGFAPGRITTIEVGEDGVLRGTYDNGQVRDLARVPLADVTNPNGLRPSDGQAFAISNSSGPMYLWDAGTGPVGAVKGFSLEASTTDIATELTQLIETQRAYSANARIIQTSDDMLAEATNLKR